MVKYGLKDGSKQGRKTDGRGKNRIENCRHPNINKIDKRR